MIKDLAAQLEKEFRHIEIWQEKKEMKTFEQTTEGMTADHVSKVETAVRVFQDDRVGFAFVSGELYDIQKLKEALNFSLQSSFRDEHNKLPEVNLTQNSFGEPKEDISTGKVLAIFDAMQLETAQMRYLKKIERLFLSDEKSEVAIFNSEAGFFSQWLNKFSLGTVLIVEKDKEAKMEWDFAIDEDVDRLDLKRIMANAYNRAVKVCNSSPTYTGNYPLLLENRSAGEFLDVLLKSFLAENVYKKRSIISDEVTFSPVIDIVEDPSNPSGSRTFYFDGEGVRAEKKLIVEQGKTKNLFFDSFYGRKYGRKSSGNSIRLKVSSPPQNGYSNVFLKSHNMDLESTIKSIGKLVVVTSLIGMHLVNPVSGDISVGFEGYLLEKGEYIKALSNMTLSGNLKQLFDNVVTAGSDISFYGNTGSPSVLVSEMCLTGI